MVALPFRDRRDAALRLAEALGDYRGSDPLVLAIPRGGVPVGRIVADALEGDLDVMLVRKIGAPGNPELAIGAIDEQGTVMLGDYARRVGADEEYVRAEATRQLALIRQRRARYRPGQPPLSLAGRTVIVVDDGVATGSTMAAALRAARTQRPKRLVCALPVAAEDSLQRLATYADDVVCLATPEPFIAVGQHYLDFDPVDDDDVVVLLARPPPRHAPAPDVPDAREVDIPAGEVLLGGELSLPRSPQGLVLFAHGSGSSRHSPRNRYVAGNLNARGIATLLFDLLTPAEEGLAAARFDIPLLAHRLSAGLDWARVQPELQSLPIGLFGASTGAAAALALAAARPGQVEAVVSRGGRPDLAGPRVLSLVEAPTLLIVGGADTDVLELNRHARDAMGGGADLAIVRGATHLFEEPGALQQVAAMAGDWFVQWLRR